MKEQIEIPTNCPCCSTLLVRVKDQLFCKNTTCSAKTSKQLEKFTKVMKIKGFGARTIDKLEITSIMELYELELPYMISTLGDKMGNKLMGELKNSITCDLSTFIPACSISLVGATAGRKVAEHCFQPSDITIEVCKKAGLGDKATANLTSWLEDVYEPTLSMLPLIFKENKATATQDIEDTGIVVCITGKIPGYTKAKLEEYLSSLGVKTASSVTKNTSYLICEELKGSSKERKANELNVKIVKFNEFMENIK